MHQGSNSLLLISIFHRFNFQNMKKVLFALPALAFTLFLAFCQKSDTQEASVAPDTNQSAGDRGPGNCQISWLSNAVVAFCGTNTNSTTCNSTCATTYPTGYETSPFNVPAGTILSVTTTSPTGTWVYVGTSVPFFVPGGTCVRVIVNNDCTVTVI